MKRTVARLGLLVVNIDGHLGCELLVNQSCNSVVIVLFGSRDKLIAFDQVVVPPWRPYFLVKLVKLDSLRTLELSVTCGLP